ncbi:MAG TPA: hypothetical protein VGG38_17185 [Acidimicrobiales bacterium]|jgi:hypothetical protein
MSMYDAFKYFEPMARLVANEGVDVNVTPQSHEGWLARVIRVRRGRRSLPQAVQPVLIVAGAPWALRPPAGSQTAA